MKIQYEARLDLLARSAPRALAAALAVALGGCVLDTAEGPVGSDEPIGTASEAIQTVTLPGNVNCTGQSAVQAELTDFVGRAEANLLADPRGGVAGYAIFASRRQSANGPLCAVATAGGMARTSADFPPATMSITTTTGVGSVSKVITAAYLVNVLFTHGISLDAAIGPYLPPTWARGPGINATTFRQLLTYTSGMPTNTDSMPQWVAEGCLPKPTLNAHTVQTYNPAFGWIKGVEINVSGTWGATTDKVVIAAPGSPDSSSIRSSNIQGLMTPGEGEPSSGYADFYFVAAGDYVARVYFEGDMTARRAEVPFHVASNGTVTMGQSTWQGVDCPFQGGRRYQNDAFKILPILASYITQPGFQSYVMIPDQSLPVPPMQVAGEFEDGWVRTNLMKAINDGNTPAISANPSCNDYKSYYAWGYPAYATMATSGEHGIADYYESCGQGTWYLSAQDLNFLLDRLHWSKVGIPGMEGLVGQDRYGHDLHYGYDPVATTAKNIPYLVKGGYLGMENDTAYQAMAAHFPNDTTVTVLVNNVRDDEDNGIILYTPINNAWDDSHPGTLTADKYTFKPSDTINFHFSGGPASPLDWIGIYPRNTPPAQGSTAWDYCGSDSHVAPPTGVSSGVVTISAASISSSTSSWTAYYLPNDGYQSIAQVDFDIKP